MTKPKNPEQLQIQVSIDIPKLYQELCPKCKEILLNMAAQSAATDVVKRQLQEQWAKK